MPPSVCSVCGREYVPLSRSQRYCTVRCRNRRPAISPTIRVECAHCGGTFDKATREAKRYPVHFCSKSCAVTHRSQRRKRYRLRLTLHQATPCRVCSTPTLAGTYCSAKCKHTYGNIGPRVHDTKTCQHCGLTWIAWQRPGRSSFCSAGCGKRFAKQEQRRKGNHKFRRKARALSVAYEPIDKRLVFQRDGWRCGICHQPVDPKLPGDHPRGATLDHIVPMNRTDLGTHTYENVQCAHRDCNVKKNRTGTSQLRLLGRL